ncbi:MAG: hypothetical protein IKD47_02245 [Clostridia bacterium]|nr:hypothetical protein [Clostridia bacterium]
MIEYGFHKGTAVAIDVERGEIAAVSHYGQSVTSGRVPIFCVKLRKKTGESYTLSSEIFRFVRFADNVASYTCEELDVDVIFQPQAKRLVCRANVKNKTPDLLEWIELMSFSVPKKLKDEQDGVGEIIYPYNEGCRVTNMAYRESMPFCYAEPDYPSKNSYSIFPNMVFAQFIAYMVGGFGIYLGMHDEERTTKHIDFCYQNDGIKIFMRAFCDVTYGQDYEMPFDCVLSFFEGGWHQAADIYYGWFQSHLPSGLTKIKDNATLPAWYHQSPLIVAYPLRGKRDTDISENGLYPYENAIPYLEEISKATDSKVMALLMHWEGTAPWAPPYSWPPYGGERQFNQFADKLHEKDMLLGLYCSGFGWTQQSHTNVEYHCEDAFERLHIAASLCADTSGEIKSTICTAQRDGYDFCPACEQTKAIFKEEFEKICSSKIDYVQALDQNHGGGPYFCYSDGHNHVPAPGKWQQIETNKLLKNIDKKGVIFGCESAAAEPFLAQLQFSDKRFELNYYVGTPIPVYEYLYHEYVNNFMGNQICAMLEKSENNFTYRLAYSFTSGDMLTVVLNGDGDLQHAWCDYVQPKDKHLDKSVVLSFIKTLNDWQRKGGYEFLHYGKMLPPILVHCGVEKFLLEDNKTYLQTDSVVTTAFQCGNRRAQFVVNYNLHDVEVTFDKPQTVYVDSDLKTSIQTEKLTLSPLTVVMIDLKE